MRERTERGEAIYELDAERLRELEPDLIVTQALCPVCAVSYDDVRAVAETLPCRPQVVALDPHTLGETLGDVRTLAQPTGSRERRRSTSSPRQRARIDAVRARGAQGRARPGGRARVARPGLRRRPLDAAADRAGRRR